jgi:histidinol dehydrogenase
MEIFINPEKLTWTGLLERPVFNVSELYEKVNRIIGDIKVRGDEALKEYTLKFDKVNLDTFQVSEKEISESEMLVHRKLKESIQVASENIRRFHMAQIQDFRKIETMPGVTCWQKAVAIEKVGLYIPGGLAPLFSTVLMLAIPAQIAGCRQIVLCSPPNAEGKIHPAILYSAKCSGVTQIFKLGGVQAIAAMAAGTESIPKVFKVFGPGNQYVTAAKQLVSMSDVAIDMPAGPSELMVVADETSNPSFVASDLLSQAEHGPDSQVVLLANNVATIEKVINEIHNQLEKLPRKEIAVQALSHSKFILMENETETIEMINQYAPEHLIICTKGYPEYSEKITSAGSVFLGNLTPESAGDYASGTNHTLPTNGWAKTYSGVNLDSFLKKITFQEISSDGLKNISATIEIMAEAEQLMAHKNAVSLRLKKQIPL